MAYIDANARTTRPTQNEQFGTLGRFPTLTGVFQGYVKNATDVQLNGRLQVWVPEFGSEPEDSQGWVTVNYCSPFAGATNYQAASKTNFNNFEDTQTSYGMWMVPPDINNIVLVMFIAGDPARGVWIGSMYNQFMNHMVPGMSTSTDNAQYLGKEIPVAEYNKWKNTNTNPDQVTRPYEKTKFKGVGNQGLITDHGRGVTTSSARRESPSNVFGILTPGPVVDKTAAPQNIHRKGGSSFIMDDGEGTEYVQLATKSGAQIRLDETNGFVYLINRDGTAWVQMDQNGNIDIFGATNISMRAQRDVNIRADRNINIEAGQNIFMKAAMDTVEETTTFTYDVNNIPRDETIPYWKYVGEGKGEGGNIVMQSLNNWQSTTKNTAYLTVTDNNMNISIGASLSVTTQNGGQDFNSKQGIKMTTDAAFDLAATGNIRVGSKGTISVVGAEGIILCTDATLSLNAGADIIETAAGAYYLDAVEAGIGTNVKIGGNLDITDQITAGTLIGNFPGLRSGPGANTGGPGAGPTPINPSQAQAAMSSGVAQPAEIKPLNEKINILATWKDPESKFKRNSEGLQTTVSKFPTYEPCPEHEQFTFASIAGFKPVITPDDKTYEGSSGPGNTVTTTPATAVNPGANNTSIVADPPSNSSVSIDVDMVALRCQLIRHEGLVKNSYLDTTKRLHGGIGHLMRANEIPMFPVGTPISDQQIETWFTQDSSSAIKISQELMGDTWGDLSDVRKRAVVDLSYNLGKGNLSNFVVFIAAMKAQKFNAAGQALRDSRWFSQVGRRGTNVIAMVVNNIDPTGCGRKS